MTSFWPPVSLEGSTLYRRSLVADGVKLTSRLATLWADREGSPWRFRNTFDALLRGGTFSRDAPSLVLHACSRVLLWCLECDCVRTCRIQGHETDLFLDRSLALAVQMITSSPRHSEHTQIFLLRFSVISGERTGGNCSCLVAARNIALFAAPRRRRSPLV